MAARTGLRDSEAHEAGFAPSTVAVQAPDDTGYYPGSHPIAMRCTGDARTGRLLGLQLVGGPGSDIAKRIDTVAAAIFAELSVDTISDPDYRPPLGSPWHVLQLGAQEWSATQPAHQARGSRRKPAET